ncbi:MAG: DUF1194 domain-containing protein [Pseudomonadota bacterium]
MRSILTLITAFIFGTATAWADIPVELELVLLADTSSSISTREFELQISGYAKAFRDPDVIAAIEGLGGNGIAVTYVQWSATFQQFDTVPWTHIKDAADAATFSDAIASQARQVISFATATGSAMVYGADSVASNGFDGKRRVIDLCSDAPHNLGPHPREVRDAIVNQDITINGLAILDDNIDLETYFKESIIGGPNSFVIAVDNYEDFATAIRLKLEQEISGKPALSSIPHRPSLSLFR